MTHSRSCSIADVTHFLERDIKPGFELIGFCKLLTVNLPLICISFPLGEKYFEGVLNRLSVYRIHPCCLPHSTLRLSLVFPDRPWFRTEQMTTAQSLKELPSTKSFHSSILIVKNGVG